MADTTKSKDASGQVFDVAHTKADPETLGSGSLASVLQRSRDMVDAGHVAGAAGGGEGRVAVSRCHVEHPPTGKQIDGLAEQLSGDGEMRALLRVDLRWPRLSLALLDRRQVRRPGLHVHVFSSSPDTL